MLTALLVIIGFIALCIGVLAWLCHRAVDDPYVQRPTGQSKYLTEVHYLSDELKRRSVKENQR